jgi:hypothetical protein
MPHHAVDHEGERPWLGQCDGSDQEREDDGDRGHLPVGPQVGENAGEKLPVAAQGTTLRRPANDVLQHGPLGLGELPHGLFGGRHFLLARLEVFGAH